MRTINVLATQRMSADDRAKIAASDPAIRLIDAGGWFDGEIRETWTAFAAARYLPPGATGSGSREERDRLLAEAEVIIGGWPFPVDLRARAPRLKWFHQRQAGASNLLGSDLWGSDIVVTTSRGVANSLPIAEYAIAGILHFAMGFNRAVIDREAGAFDHRAYRPLLVQGKTACVVGAGGIGSGDAPGDLAEGDYVIVSVSDVGTGMSEATLARAFEPFFTTKEVGRGSGLGLSMVQGFAAQSGGAVQIASSLGKGTTVELWLPPAERQSRASVSAEPGEFVFRQRQARILVCDDDKDVCSLVGTLLRDLGHLVWEAAKPTLALQILERERPVDLLLVDYAMPEMNGRTVIDRARACQPGLKTLLMTGYAEALRNNGMSEIPVLRKPFKAAELSRRIAEILNELSFDDSAESRNTLH
jgi:CheY-like chemotaxis protein